MSTNNKRLSTQSTSSATSSLPPKPVNKTQLTKRISMTSPINTAPQLFASPNQIPHSLIATKKYSSKLSISLSTSKSIQVPMQDITGFLRLTPDIKHEIKITEIMIQIDGFEGSKSNRQRFFNSPAKLQNNVQLDSTRTIPYTLEFQNNTLISSFYNQSIKIHDIFGGVTYCISALVNFTVDGTSYQTSTYLNVIVADILERKIETPVLMKATAPTRTLFNNLSGEISITAQPIIMEWESGSLGLVNVNIVNNSLKKVRKISVYLVERFKNNVSFSRRIVSKKSYGGWNCWFDGVDGNESKDLQVDVLVPVGAASIVGKMVQVSYAALVKVRFGFSSFAQVEVPVHVKNKVSSIKKADEYFNADELDLLNYATSTEFADDNSIHSSISISRHSTPSINYGREDEQNRISPKRNSSPTRDRIIDQRKIITRNPAPVIPLTKKELDNRRQNLTRDISPTYIDVRRNITPVENTITILKSEQPYIVLKKNSILNVAAREKEKVAAPGSKGGKFVRTRSLTEINRIIDLCENEVGIDGMLKEIN